jgi:hypothetical protein
MTFPVRFRCRPVQWVTILLDGLLDNELSRFAARANLMIAALLILAAATAPPVALECPAISGETLVYVSIYDGPPEQDADLAPDDTKKAGEITSNIWKLAAEANGLFVKCGYGKKLEGPYRRMETIRLPDAVTGCRADFKPGPKPSDLILTHFSCR